MHRFKAFDFIIIKENIHRFIILQKIMAKHPNPISSHVLDTASGLPAPGIGITFEKFDEVKKDWIHIVRK